MSAGGLHWWQPVVGGQDLLGPLRQFERWVAVVGSVAHLVANDPGSLLPMSCSGGDRGEVKPRDFFVGCRGGCDLGRRPGCVEVAFCEGMSRDQVGDIDDAAYQVMVEPITLVQPGPPSGPEFVERLPGHQLECMFEVVYALCAAGFSADPEAAEEVGVDQQVFDLVDPNAAGLRGGAECSPPSK